MNAEPECMGSRHRKGLGIGPRHWREGKHFSMRIELNAQWIMP